MEFIFELLFQVILEFVLQIFGEVLIELGLHSLAKPFKEREARNPLLAFIGYVLLGSAVGGLSLLVFPKSFVRSSRLHGISLLITPLLAGIAMSGLGWLRLRQGKRLLRLDSFVYGAIFAFGMALVRFLFTT
ncbi:MAG: hypothetical protein H7Z75_21780 [Ferruginibacter sp.]|nr:hypothetical protein [Cytophagales bacterium]